MTGAAGPGLLVVSGKMAPGNSLADGEKAVDAVINDLLENGLAENELQKVKNKAESSLVFSETELINRATNLALYKFLGDVDLINREITELQSVDENRLLEMARKILKEENATVLYYQAANRE